ncbi:MAG TPA: protein kinase [Vicinamibacterales bacterium]
MMTPGFWSDATRIFDEALAVDPTQRDAYLSEACRGNAELLAEVRSLLSWHDDSVSFLEHPIARVTNLAFDRPDPLIGQSLGPWRIVDVIGHGGMGMVYRAERADDAFRREVAIKVVRQGVDAQGIVSRFRRERETLAALDHPNIARVFDGGTTTDGDPYFVMEYVDGIGVDRYCDEHRLSIDERLRLFLEICRGVQYAHQNFVVHRDLKPDNILVSRDGVPKLLDFGIARLLSPAAIVRDEDSSNESTWLLTPDFASPEQMAGRAVTAATDVYSLGVLLHVLLTGERPYRLAGTTRERLQSELSAAAFVPPSSRFGVGGTADERASARSSTPRQLARRLTGDLDAIVTRAANRDAGARYPTVEQLIDDVERHRHSEVVLARRRDPWYVVTRFLQRHALAAAVTTTILLVIAAGVAGVLWQASIAADAQSRAERRFEDVRQLARAFMFDVHDEIANLPGSTRARELLVSTGSEYVQRLLREAENDVELQRELAAAFVKLGDAQGHPNSANLGDTASARRSYQQAIATAQAVLAAIPGDLGAQRTLALAHRRNADVLAWTGELDAALVEGERSRQEFRTLAAMPDATGEDRLQALIGDIKVGDVLGNPNLPNLGRYDEAMPLYEAALDALRADLTASPADQRIRRYIGIALERIGTLHQRARNWESAAVSYGESLEVRRALAVEAPLHTDIQRDLAVAFEKMGNVELFSGRSAAAVRSYRSALDGFQKLASADPSNVTAMRSVAIAREHLADAHRAAGAQSAGLTELMESARLQQRLAALDRNNMQARCDTARLQEKVGDFTAASADACASWQTSLAAFEPLARSGIPCATPEILERLQDKLQVCR